MEKYYVIKMENGEDWGIPAHIIAENKANYYGKNDADKWNEEYNLMMVWFDDHDYEFADWAQNNMDWDDVKDHAILLKERCIEENYQEYWVNGEYEYRTLN